jgi:hypothetical protein
VSGFHIPDSSVGAYFFSTKEASSYAKNPGVMARLFAFGFRETATQKKSP